MQTYTILELSDPQSIREGVTKEFKSLTEAKRFATKNQVFQSTILKILAKNGELVAIKSGSSWHE